MTNDQNFVEKLIQILPELRPAFDEHIRDYGELLPHVFMGDVTRWTIDSTSKVDRSDAVGRLLNSLDDGLTSGSPEVRELILASFVENLIGERVAVEQLAPLMGPKLKAAVQAQPGIL